MRIRDRLIALATASLAPSRTTARGPVTDEPAEPGGSEPDPELAPRPLLPRQLGEQLLQSIHQSRQRLQQTSEALAAIAGALATTELAVRDLLERKPRVPHPTSAMSLALAAANARTPDGGFLFPGTGADPPFASDGGYLGPSSTGIIVVLPGPPPCLAVPAAALTCLASVPSAGDVLPRLARAQNACTSATPRALESCREPLAAATHQLTHLQARVATALTVLSDATLLTSEILPDRPSLPTDSTTDPALLAQAFSDLEAARSLAERTLAIFPPDHRL